VIDVFKMDIEGGEWKIIENMNIDYACAYFKQFHFETHQNKLKNLESYNILKSLEKCFMLFRRDTRFFQPIHSPKLGYLTEFQQSANIDIKNYGSNGEEAILYMLTMGEFYFVNKNFL